jgi:hypothetical protein
MKRYLYILLFVVTSSYSLSDEQYDELFVSLSNEGIVVGKDISTEDLYTLIENGDIYLKNGQIDQGKLNKRVKELLAFKEKQYDEINQKIDKNPNSKIHKEIKEYFDDNNKRIEDAQNDFSKSDDDGWFSKTVNYILELMKY